MMILPTKVTAAKSPYPMEVAEAKQNHTCDCPYRRTYHSDQGWAYQMKAYVNTLKKNKNFQSMSRDELKNAIERYIHYYNTRRIKQKLGGLSPVNYRLNLLAA